MKLAMFQCAATVGRVLADGLGVSAVHPVGPGAAAAGARQRHGGGRRLPAGHAAVVRHVARPHAAAVPGGLRLRLRRVLTRCHAHPDDILQGVGPQASGELVCVCAGGLPVAGDRMTRCVCAGRVAGRADGRGLPVARAGPGVRGGGVRAPRAGGHVRQHGGADAGGAGGAARGVRAAAAGAAGRAPRRRARAARVRPGRDVTSLLAMRSNL